MKNEYWLNRVAANQNALSEKNIKKTEKQLRKYYANTMKHVIAEFERIYNKLLMAVEDGREPTPADLYKLDTYWQMQGQMRQQLQKLSERQISKMTKIFEINYFEV